MIIIRWMRLNIFNNYWKYKCKGKMSTKCILLLLLYEDYQMRGAKCNFVHKSQFRLSISLIFPNEFVPFSLKKLFFFSSWVLHEKTSETHTSICKMQTHTHTHTSTLMKEPQQMISFYSYVWWTFRLDARR